LKPPVQDFRAIDPFFAAHQANIFNGGLQCRDPKIFLHLDEMCKDNDTD
jgi:hypothetical protein